ncbi:MAG TPA: LysR family transcriptional regulator [Methylocella sp.]|nr:LysR family transcriptional regulator [Methylocella sp.]
MGQPTVSDHVRKLEKAVGHRLFVRDIVDVEGRPVYHFILMHLNDIRPSDIDDCQAPILDTDSKTWHNILMLYRGRR